MGCQVGGNGGVATWTPSPSLTPTCVPDIQISTPEGWGAVSRLFVILYDPRSVGEQNLEFSNNDATKDIPTFVQKVIPEIMQPGDQVAVFQLGYSNYDAARVTRLYSYTTLPPLYNTPAPRATLTPLPPTKFPTPGFEAVATDNFMRVETTKRANIEAENLKLNDCEVISWNTKVKLTATVWNVTATAEVNDIHARIKSEFELFYSNSTAIETPFRTNELYYGGVYFGLDFATTIFNADCKQYTECVLIIIDDLELWDENNPDNLPIALNEVKQILAIMPNCEDIDQPSCARLKNYWTNEFARLGAAVEPEYWNGERAEIKLLEAIGR